MVKRLLFLGLSFVTFTLCSVNAYSENNENIAKGEANSIPSIPFFTLESITDDGTDENVTNQVDLDALADSLTEKVLGENKIVDMLDPEKVYTLPIGIVKEIAGVFYTIVLDNLKFTPQGATMKAYISLSFPGSTKKFGLVADNVKIGINGIQAAQLKMISDKPIDLMNSELLIDADSTFIEWDCNGYKGAQLSAKIFLDESKFYKENPSTRKVITGAKVTGKIFCSVTDFNDILLSVSLDPFQIKDIKDFSFYPKNIVLDLSDSRNDNSMQFPSGYQSVLFDGQNKNLWRGLYISSFALKFPKTFAKSGNPPEVVASNFLIDLEGVTGTIALNAQLISFEQGNLGGWKFSVNSLSLSFIKNNISGFAMAGGIILPITEQNKPLNYTAAIDQNKDFLFQVTLPGNINAPLFGSGSSLKIDSNSRITVQSKDGDFYPKAELYGQLNIQIPGGTGLSLADIRFEGLTIQRDEPQVDIQHFSMQSGAMAGFPVQINKIEVIKNIQKKELGLLFDASANLMQEKITGATSFVVWASRSTGEWKYKEVEFRKITVDAETGPIALKGTLINYKDDPVYGNGYYGSVLMSMTPGFSVDATAQFGNISGNRYWYADASLTLSSGITVFPGFAIYGFGGGAYYHMERIVPSNIIMANNTNTTQTPTLTPGKTSSGITYKPNSSISLGLNAKVIIGTQPSPNAFNGNVTFGMEFNSGLGLNKIYFQGNGRFMTEVTSSGEDAKFKASVNIEYLFAQKELSGYAEAFINVADVIKGEGDNNKAGRVEFYFAPSKWHIYIGTPSSPINLKLMNALSASSYFMVGTEMPDFPGLPAEVANLSGSFNFNNLRDPNLTRNGGGFAFGAAIRASTGEKNFLIFYGKFDMGAGFDFMLKNFGTEARCEGFSGPLGINGWYAQGQAWAYVDAKIGVKVKVFGDTKKFNFMEAGFAAVLAAQLPNPTYLAGAVETHFSVLGGLVKGKCHFEFDYGNQCKLTGASAVEGVSAIAELTPAEGSREIDVFTTPQVAFNMPVEEEFSILDTDGKNKSFRVKLDYFKVTDNGVEIPSTQEWNANHDVLALRTTEVLPGQKPLKVAVKIRFQKKDAGGGWTDYTVNGKVEGEEKIFAFTTGTAPDYITENNVEYTYPVKNMVNFYKAEYNQSYIQLYKGISYLFSTPDDWRYEAHFRSGENFSKMPVTYDNTKMRVVLNVPDNLVNSSIYKMRIVRVPNTTAIQVDKNVQNIESSLTDDQTVTTKDIEGTMEAGQETELYSLHFRTSKYNTFVEKMNNLTKGNLIQSICQGVNFVKLKLTGDELFDAWEVENIKSEALVNETKWYVDNYKGLLYSSYPIAEGMNITWRDYNTVGVPPVKSCFVLQNQPQSLLSESNITTNSYSFLTNNQTKIENRLAYYISGDYSELRTKAFSQNVNSNNTKIVEIKNSIYTGMYFNNKYFIKLKYLLPGISLPNSVYTTYISI